MRGGAETHGGSRPPRRPSPRDLEPIHIGTSAAARGRPTNALATSEVKTLSGSSPASGGAAAEFFSRRSGRTVALPLRESDAVFVVRRPALSEQATGSRETEVSELHPGRLRDRHLLNQREKCRPGMKKGIASHAETRRANPGRPVTRRVKAAGTIGALGSTFCLSPARRHDRGDARVRVLSTQEVRRDR